MQNFATEKKAPKLNKSALARTLKVSRGSLYYTRKRPLLDNELKLQIEAVLTENPAYGHKRIAIELKMGKNRIKRVMKLFGLAPYRKRKQKPQKKADAMKLQRKDIINVSKILCPIAPYIVWVADFTYIRFHESFVYVATVMDLYTREIVGWHLARTHSTALVLAALSKAVVYTDAQLAIFFHTDQGSEYDSFEHERAIEKLGMIVSMSDKASPWQNGYQESFYSHFKNDFGDHDRFDSLGELVEAVALHIMYYNTKRNHSTLGMPPTSFRLKHVDNTILIKRLANVFKKSGT
jgi:putative transposase